ncbi:MAG: hypothetical protein ACKV0T_16050 [Planctomycetales bacterium]
MSAKVPYRHRLLAASCSVLLVWSIGCGKQETPDLEFKNVEQELKNHLSPPNAIVSILIGGRMVKLQSPAMRVNQAALDPHGELIVVYVAFPKGEKTTQSIEIDASEAAQIVTDGVVTLGLGGNEGGIESLPLSAWPLAMARERTPPTGAAKMVEDSSQSNP